MRVSHSSLDTFATCPRLYQYKYIDRYEPLHDTIELRFGSAWHAGQETYWKTGNVAKACERFNTQPVNDDEKLQLGMLMVKYDEMYGHRKYTPILIEEKRRVTMLGAEFDLVMDCLVKNEDDEYILIEHKTTGTKDLADGGTYHQRSQVSPQHAIYCLAAREMGYNIAAVCYDVTRRIQTRRHKATPEHLRKYRKSDGQIYMGQFEEDETFPQFKERLQFTINTETDIFKQFWFEPTEETLAAASRDLEGWIHAVGNSQYPKSTGNCTKYRNRCEFWTVCHEGNTLYDKTLFKERTR